MSTEQKPLEDMNTRLLDLVHRLSLADEFNEALATLLEQASDLLPCDGISVMLLTGDHLDVLGSRGATAPMGGLTLPASQMGAGRAVLDSSRVVVVADTEEDRRWERVPGEEQVLSWMGAPLQVEGRTIGLLTWSAKEPERFNGDDAELAGRIAGNVAPLLYRAQVLDDTRLRLRELVEPRLDMMPRATDLGTELQPIVLEALEFVQARHAFAFVRAQSNHSLRCVAASGEQRDRLMRCTLRGDGTLGGWSVPMEGSSEWLSSGPSDREVMAALGIEQTLILPLRACGKEVGMLGVAEPRRGKSFERDAMRLMTHLASQASLSVERVSPVSQDRKRYDYEMVIQSAPLGIGVLTVTGDIRVANPALAGQLSRSKRNLEGYNLSEFLLPRDARRLEHLIEEVAVTGQRRHMEAGIKVVSGAHRYVRISLALTHVSSDAGATWWPWWRMSPRSRSWKRSE